MLRLIVNKARHHYNVALEHAERQRYNEALAELEHSIDLDNSFAPAHVVMGTIHARLEDFEAAERCWRAALELDPNIEKAHDYLAKSDRAQAALPLVRRLRGLAWVAVAAAALFVLLSIWSFAPSRDRRNLARIERLFADGRIDQAYEIARQLESSGGDRDVRAMAALFVEAIDRRFENSIIEIVKYLLDNRPLDAHELYENLIMKRAAPEAYRRQLEPLDRRAAMQAIAMIDTWASEYEADTLSYEDFLRNVTGVREAFDREDVTARAKAVLADAGRTRGLRLLASIPASVESTSETIKWVSRLNDLAAEMPEVRDEAASASARLLEDAYASIASDVDLALIAGDTDALQKALGGLELLKPFGLPEGSEALVKRIRTGLERVDVGQLLAFLDEATIEDIPKVAVTTAQYETVSTATVENAAELREAIDRARRRLAFEMHAWCLERDSQYESRSISEEDAQFTVDRAEFVLRYIRARDWRYVRDNIMFYALSSWLKLGNEAEAEKWYQRLVNTYPESPYVETARNWRQPGAP